MKIRTKLIFNYSFLTMILMVTFIFVVLLFYIQYLKADFKSRLHNRAKSSVMMLIDVPQIDSAMLRIIDNNTLTTMQNFEIIISDSTGKIIYSNYNYPKVFQTSENNYLFSGQIALSFNHYYNNRMYIVDASAVDYYGRHGLRSILLIMFLVLFLSILLIVTAGIYNANWSLKPFRDLITEVEGFQPVDMKKRLTISGSDELAQLSDTFNKLLDRIEQAFETEKSFVAHASHELRTPVTAISGQLEVALNKSRTKEEYKNVLDSVYEDILKMKAIINGFLELAEVNISDQNIGKFPVRIDELLFAVIDDFKKNKPNYTISVDFITVPENDNQLLCSANERLLKILFGNLIDNACKYSEKWKADIKIDFSSDNILILIIDKGIGIPKEDIHNIFQPLFRGQNAPDKNGYGIGLALVKRIAELHDANIIVDSELLRGTTVTIKIKK